MIIETPSSDASKYLGDLTQRGLPVDHVVQHQHRHDRIEGTVIEAQRRRIGLHHPWPTAVWQSDPLFYPVKPPAHWLMVAEVAGQVLVVLLASPDSADVTRCRPIGCYIAASHLVTHYREDR